MTVIMLLTLNNSKILRLLLKVVKTVICI